MGVRLGRPFRRGPEISSDSEHAARAASYFAAPGPAEVAGLLDE